MVLEIVKPLIEVYYVLGLLLDFSNSLCICWGIERNNPAEIYYPITFQELFVGFISIQYYTNSNYMGWNNLGSDFYLNKMCMPQCVPNTLRYLVIGIL